MKFCDVLLFAVAAAAASTPVEPKSPTSSVKGKAFDRFITVWLENTDYDKAAGDPNLQFLATKGITLSNYFALTHPSMPNYIGAVSGDYYGVNHDDFLALPRNISSVADLLDDAGIAWGEYQEDMPYTGFTEMEFDNPKTRANMYVRKHNPLVIHDSVSLHPERLARIKNTTFWDRDIEDETLPQWMFVTPNMTSDGHDSSVTTAGAWTRALLEPLLDNEYFMDRTLILVTFDENHSYSDPNRVFSILLGGAVPESLHGTKDEAYYDHYSEIATVVANWDLHTLGRYDVGANVFALVANKTGDVVRKHPDLAGVLLNESYPGVFNDEDWAPQPAPNTTLVDAKGRTVLGSIVDEWEGMQKDTVYTGALEVPSKENPPKTPSGTPEPSSPRSKSLAAVFAPTFYFAAVAAAGAVFVYAV
ncbi:acid phosphatase [Geopyxis carbonaria]|nr:acid phosphatase [Geopyxis carbonaria]